MNRENRKKQAELERKLEQLKHADTIDELTHKLDFLPEAFAQNEKTKEKILSLPKDEIKILLKEIFASDQFEIFLNNTEITSTKLNEVRQRKSEKRSSKKSAALQTNSVVTDDASASSNSY